MKIVYLIHSLQTAGGMEKILSSKANWLCRQEGIEVYVITSHLRSRKPFFQLDERIHLLDADVNDRIWGLKYRRRLQQFLDEIKPDVTVTLCGSDAFQLLKCHSAGVKLAEYHFLHDKFYRKYPRWSQYAWFRTMKLNSALQKFDALVVLSKYDLDYYKAAFKYPGKVYRIGNTLSDTAAIPSGHTRKRFVCVGRLSAEKNVADAIRIWKLVSAKYPDWHLDIYGDGSERENLEKLVEELCLSQYVTLRGNSKSVMSEYADSSGLLITSHYEGFGLVLMEAASCSVPAVAFSCHGGLVELIDEGNTGYVVEQGDIWTAADRVCWLIENEDIRKAMGAKARERAKEYAPENIMNKWLELFNTLTHRNA